MPVTSDFKFPHPAPVLSGVGAATGKLCALVRATGEVPVTVRRPRKGGTPDAHAVPSSRCIFVTKLTIMYRF